MDAKWVPAVYYTPGREAPVRRIVLHWMATTLAGCDATFTGGGRQASAHYGIENHTVHQYVREHDTAWHSGVRAINHESIGIEHSAQPGRDATEQTIATSIALCTELCRRHGLTADAIGYHSQFYATQCPGTIPVTRIREAVRNNLAGKPQLVAAPEAPALKEWDVMATKDEIRAVVREEIDAAFRADVIPSPMFKTNPTVARDSALRFAMEWALQARDRAGINPATLAAEIVKALPAGGTSQADVEAALRNVLGSLDT